MCLVWRGPRLSYRTITWLSQFHSTSHSYKAFLSFVVSWLLNTIKQTQLKETETLGTKEGCSR